jgi:hypothetical protein
MSSLVSPGKFLNRNSNYAPSTSIHILSTLNFRVSRRIIWAAGNFVQYTIDYCYSWNSSNLVGTETMLQTRASGVWNPIEARDFTFTPAVGPSQPPIPGVERTGRELQNPPPSTGEVKNGRYYKCTDLYAFMAWTRKILPFVLSLLLSLLLLFVTLPFCFGCYWCLSPPF